MIIYPSRRQSWPVCILSVLVLISLLVASTRSQSDIPDDFEVDLVSLHDDNIEEETKKGTWLIFFRWGTQDIWSQIPKENYLAEFQDVGIRIGLVDAELNKETSRKYKVKGLPSLVLIHEGNVYKERRIGNMYRFVLRHYDYRRAMTYGFHKDIDFYATWVPIGGGFFVLFTILFLLARSALRGDDVKPSSPSSDTPTTNTTISSNTATATATETTTTTTTTKKDD